MTGEPDRRAVTREVVAALRARIDDLARYLLGEPNRAHSSKRELRFGSKGALCVWISGEKRGGWADFSGDAKGDPLSLIKYARQCDFLAAVALASQFLGWPDDDKAPRPAPIVAPSWRQGGQSASSGQTEADRRADAARRLWSEREPAAGTLADRYLTEVRAIPRPDRWPHAVGYHRGQRAMILAATNWAGTLRAVQLVKLTESGQNARRETGDKIKISRGALAGVAVRLQGWIDGPLLLAEGPETGLSVWRATGWDTWIALGGMARLSPPAERPVIVCGDDDPTRHVDPRKLAAVKSLLRAMDGWTEAGVCLTLATPSLANRHDKSDFNDLLREGGIAAVRDRLGLAREALRNRLRNKRIPYAIGALLTRHAPAVEILTAAHAANVGLLLTKREVHAVVETLMLAQMRDDGKARFRRRAAA